MAKLSGVISLRLITLTDNAQWRFEAPLSLRIGNNLLPSSGTVHLTWGVRRLLVFLIYGASPSQELMPLFLCKDHTLPSNVHFPWRHQIETLMRRRRDLTVLRWNGYSVVVGILAANIRID